MVALARFSTVGPEGGRINEVSLYSCLLVSPVVYFKRVQGLILASIIINCHSNRCGVAMNWYWYRLWDRTITNTFKKRCWWSRDSVQ